MRATFYDPSLSPVLLNLQTSPNLVQLGSAKVAAQVNGAGTQVGSRLSISHFSLRNQTTLASYATAHTGLGIGGHMAQQPFPSTLYLLWHSNAA